MDLIRAQSCRSCKHSHLAGMGPDGPGYECRRYPPAAGPVIVPVKPGVMSVQIHGGFPAVKEDFWCGEYVQRLAVMSNELHQPIIDLEPAPNSSDPILLSDLIGKSRAA